MSVNTSTVRLQSRSTGEEQITIAEYRQLQPQKHYFDQLNNLQITCDPRKNISENAVPQKWSWSEMMSAFQNQIQMAHIQKYMNTGLMLLQKVSRIVNQKIILSKKWMQLYYQTVSNLLLSGCLLPITSRPQKAGKKEKWRGVKSQSTEPI